MPMYELVFPSATGGLSFPEVFLLQLNLGWHVFQDSFQGSCKFYKEYCIAVTQPPLVIWNLWTGVSFAGPLSSVVLHFSLSYFCSVHSYLEGKVHDKCVRKFNFTGNNLLDETSSFRLHLKLFFVKNYFYRAYMYFLYAQQYIVLAL
jgi:hypothetical protein